MRVLFLATKSQLFAAIKEITILFSTRSQKLRKSGEEDLQTVGYEQEFIEDKSKSKNTRKASA